MHTAKRYFNTSGPNIRAEHYTLERKALVAVGMDMVRRSRYFTIWAPRQSGKSTYFRLLAEELTRQGYKVAHINFENFQKNPVSTFLRTLKEELHRFTKLDFANDPDMTSVFRTVQNDAGNKYVLSA